MPHALCVISLGESSSLRQGEKRPFLDGYELKMVAEGQLPACHPAGKVAVDIILQIMQ